MELKEYVRVIRKRIWILLVLVIVATAGAGLYTHYLVDPLYQASAKLIVVQSGDNGGPLTYNDVNTNIRLISTYKELVQTAVILDDVVAQYPDLHLSANQLAKKVEVSSVNDTQVMTVSAQDPSYERAAQIVNAVSLVFQHHIPDIMNVNNVKILSLAEDDTDPQPVAPNLRLNLLLGAFASAIVAIGLIFLIEYLDDSIKRERDVQDVLGLPLLGVIATISKKEYKKTGAVSADPSQRKVGESSHAASQ